MRLAAVLVSVIVIMFTSAFVIKASNPDLYIRLALSMDVIGISPDSKEEKERIALINMLPISEEKKEILIKRTIFLGASPAMVKLALGLPMNSDEDTRESGKHEERWVYHFDKDIKPTALVFVDGELVSAHVIQ